MRSIAKKYCKIRTLVDTCVGFILHCKNVNAILNGGV